MYKKRYLCGGCPKCGGGLAQKEQRTFSNTDIMKLTGTTNIITYPELGRYHNIDEVLDHNGVVVILYETSGNFGHWVALFKVANNTLEFFDSLGFKVDEELNIIPKQTRIYMGEVVPHLTNILSRSNYKVIQNTYPLQKFKHSINTCGRWVSGRLVLRDIPLKLFIKKFTSGLPEQTPDELITEFTENLMVNCGLR